MSATEISLLTEEAIDEIAREYAEAHPELGALEDIEGDLVDAPEAGLTYLFEHGAVRVLGNLKVLAL